MRRLSNCAARRRLVQGMEPLEPRIVLSNTASWTATGGRIFNGQVEGMTAQSNLVSGAIHAVVAHPTNANTLWVGTVNGGIWKTTTAGNTVPIWNPLTDEQASLSISALVLDPTDVSFNTLVAGIGRYSSFGREGGPRAGLLRTTNGGFNWTPITGGGILQGKNISGVAARGSTIVVSVNTSDFGDPADLGVFRSTDNGSSFTRISAGAGTGLPDGAAYDLASDPTNNDILYVSVAFSTANGIYKSTNKGATWSKVSNATIDGLIIGTTSNMEIAVGQSNNVYVGIINQGQLAGLFRSGNGGTNWTQLDTPRTNENGTFVGINPRPKGPGEGATPGEIAGGQGAVHFSIAADPNNANLVYVGGDRQPGQFSGGVETDFFPNSLGAMNYSGRLFRVNAAAALGSQATALTHNGSTTLNSAPHADSREITFDANGNMIEVDDGGIYKRTVPSGTGNWFPVHGTLQNAEFHSIAYDALSNTLFGGTQDVGAPRQIGAGDDRWNGGVQGDGGAVEIDNVTLAGSSQSLRYVSNHRLQQFRRQVFNASAGFVSETFPSLNVVGTGQTLSQHETAIPFYAPIIVNSVNPQRGLIATANLYESTDQFNNLTKIVTGAIGITAMAYGGTGNANAIYYGRAGGLFLRSAAAGAFSAITAYNGQAPSDIVLDPDDWQTAIVVDSNQVFRLTNSGASVADVTGNLASLLGFANQIRTVTYVESVLDDGIIIGTDIGAFLMYVSAPGVWEAFGPNLPNTRVTDLRYNAADNVLVAGTLGRGAWIMNLASQTFGVNNPPTLALQNQTSVLPENTNTSAALNVADIVVTDDQNGANTLALGGADAALFEIVNNKLRIKAGSVLDFETNSQLDVFVTVDDPTVGNTPDDVVAQLIDITNVNEPPSVALSNTVTALAENANTSARTKMADITVIDDSLGTETLSLTGDDAAMFEIFTGDLYLRANAVLDFETNPVLNVIVNVNDATVGGNPDDSEPLAVTITDVNEAPSIVLSNAVALLAEDVDTSSAIKVADIDVLDDALGNNSLTLSGTDAALFEITSGDLFLIAGAALDFETNPVLDVVVSIDDPIVGASPDDSESLTINITDANEPPEGAVVVAGVAQEDSMLTADTSGLTDQNGLGTFHYQWRRSTDDFNTVENVGDDSDAYVLSDADVEAKIRVVVRYTDGQGTAEAVASTAVGPVTNVNDAPVLDNALAPLLPSIDEDTVGPPGELVSTLIAGAVTDADAGALQGLAMTFASHPGRGTWQYSLNNGDTWLQLGTPSTAAARLLPADANTRVRFVPNANFNGQVKIVFRAWDRTQGTSGDTFDIPAGGAGGATAFSAAIEQATLTINPVNDAPVLNNALAPALTPINEDDTNPAGTLVSSLLTGAVTDADAGASRGIAITSASNSAQGTWQYSLDGGANWQNLGAPGVAAARLLPSNELSRVRFVSNLNYNGQVKLFYRAWDQTQGAPGDTFDLSGTGKVGGTRAFSTAVEQATLTINSVNDAPAVTVGSTVGYTLNSPAVLVATTATVSDVDSPNFDSGRLVVRIVSGGNSSNRLLIGGAFTIVNESGVQNVVRNGVTIGTLNANGGIGTTKLEIAFNANATVGIVQQLVRAIKFRTVNSTSMVNRTIAFRVFDGDGGASNEVQTVVQVQ